MPNMVRHDLHKPTIFYSLIMQEPIVRIAPNELAIAGPKAIKTIYSIHSGFTKACSGSVNNSLSC